MQMMPKHIFRPVFNFSTVQASTPPELHALSVVLRRISGRSHFRSRDKDGGHTVRFAIVENLLIHTNFTAQSSLVSELLPIKVLHCRNRKCNVFFAKNSGKYKNVLFTPPKRRRCRSIWGINYENRQTCDLYRCAKKYNYNGGVKIDTDDDNFTHMHPRPLYGREIPTYASGWGPNVIIPIKFDVDRFGCFRSLGD